MNIEKNPFDLVSSSQWGSAKVGQNEYSCFVCVSRSQTTPPKVETRRVEIQTKQEDSPNMHPTLGCHQHIVQSPLAGQTSYDNQ